MAKTRDALTIDELRAREVSVAGETDRARQRLGLDAMPRDLQLGKTLDAAMKDQGGWPGVMKIFVPYLAQEAEAYRRLEGLWSTTTQGDRRLLRPEDFLAAADIAPADFYADLARIAFIVSRNQAALMLAVNQPKVVEAAVESAVIPGKGGASDRKLLLQMGGLAPTPRGQSVNITMNGVGEAQISGEAMPRLEPFEGAVKGIRDEIRAKTKAKIKEIDGEIEGEIVEAKAEIVE